MSAPCSCQHEDNSTLCSHRLTLLRGELGTMSLVEGTEEDVKKIPLMVAGSDIDQALKALESAEEMMQEANQDYREAKAQMIDAMND